MKVLAQDGYLKEGEADKIERHYTEFIHRVDGNPIFKISTCMGSLLLEEVFQLIGISKRGNIKLNLSLHNDVFVILFIQLVGYVFNVNIDKCFLKVANSAYSKRKIHLQELKITKEEDQLEKNM